MLTMGYENMVVFIKSRMRFLGINQGELAQKSGLSASQISRILKLESTPSQDAIASIARALRIDVETVFRAAGILPAKTDEDPWVEQQTHILEQITDPALRRMAESLIRNVSEQQEEKNSGKNRTTTSQAHI